MTGAPRPVVVVGAGIAGVSVAASLRSSGYAGPLVLVGDEPVLPYRRPTVSKGLVRGTQSLDQVLVKPEEWYAGERVELRRGVAAVAVEGRELVLADGERIGFGHLVLATGGRARRLPGLEESSRVLTLRTAADAERLTTALEGQQGSVVVVGAGPLGEVYADLHRSRGVDLQTGVDVAKVLDTGRDVLVGSMDGRSWTASLVVVAVGLEPDLALAASAGVETHDAGVVVDHAGRTSVPGVWAAGDLTVRPSSYTPGAQRAEHWAAAQAHGTAVGRALAAELAGEEPPPSFDEVPWAWSDQYSLNLQLTGWPDAADEVVLRGEPSGADDASWVAFFVRDGVLRGAVGVGRARDIRQARVLVGQRATVDPALLADPGTAVTACVAGS
jgi:NADPH-dependent 2,4-dienoyl-CoA reductase/sulfur reductase-like enzyme